MVNFHAEVNICFCPHINCRNSYVFFINLIFMSLSKKEIYKGVVTKSFFIKHILYLLLMVLMVLFMKLLIYDYC